ncbi:MAG: hypothetical protein ACD_20C00137G0011 [uncultured bacterium]|nr:MAG: hypothetical protein ACD_20C00137G0011 [uncultured bacterium]HBH19068.1 hypothetical protein [Cyanobacteria bacterium UBA9579]
MNNIQERRVIAPVNLAQYPGTQINQPNIFTQSQFDSISFSGKVSQKLSSKLVEKFSNKLKLVLAAIAGPEYYVRDIKTLAHNETVELMAKNPKGALQKAKHLLQINKQTIKETVKRGYLNSSDNNAWLISTYNLVGTINGKLGKRSQEFLNYAKGYETYLKTGNRAKATPMFKHISDKMIKMAEEGNKPDLANKIKTEVKKYSAKI